MAELITTKSRSWLETLWTFNLTQQKNLWVFRDILLLRSSITLAWTQIVEKECLKGVLSSSSCGGFPLSGLLEFVKWENEKPCCLAWYWLYYVQIWHGGIFFLFKIKNQQYAFFQKKQLSAQKRLDGRIKYWWLSLYPLYFQPVLSLHLIVKAFLVQLYTSRVRTSNFGMPSEKKNLIPIWHLCTTKKSRFDIN